MKIAEGLINTIISLKHMIKLIKGIEFVVRGSPLELVAAIHKNLSHADLASIENCKYGSSI